VGVISSDWHVPAAIAWTGIVTTALTCFGENLAMKKLSAAESTIIYSTEPLWGTAFAAAFLGETVGWNTFVGAALILSACMWSSIGPSFSIAGGLATMQSSMAEQMEEMMTNISLNWSELMETNSNLLNDTPN